MERCQVALTTVVEGHWRSRKARMRKPNEIKIKPSAMWPGVIWR
jgi:hypothetical protein